MEIILIDLNRLPRSISIGRQYDNAATAIKFQNLEFEDDQTAYLLVERKNGPCAEPEVFRIEADEFERFIIKRPLTDRHGPLKAQLEIISNNGSEWHSEVFILEVGIGINGGHENSFENSSYVNWGNITGALVDQEDLFNELEKTITGVYVNEEEIEKGSRKVSIEIPITSISKNGTTIEPVERNVDITLDEYALVSDLPSKVSDLENDLEYITQTGFDSGVSGKADQSQVDDLKDEIDSLGDTIEELKPKVDDTAEKVGQIESNLTSKADKTDIEGLQEQIDSIAEMLKNALDTR